MDITIGMKNVARELSFETDATPDEVTKAYENALVNQTVFSLTDAKGRTFLLNPTIIAYVELGKDSGRRVGFGA